MRHRNNQLNVSHTLTTHFFFSYFYPATIADNAFITDTFVLTAVAFPVLYRPEDALTKQSVALWFICPVIDGFGFQYFTARTLENHFRRSETDGNFGKIA